MTNVARLAVALAITASVILSSHLASAQFVDQEPSADGVAPTTAEQPTEANRGWGWIPLPKITLPTIPMPKIEMPKMAESATAPIKTSAQKISSGAKRAWQGTKELFSFARGRTSDEEPTRVASRPRPSLWQKMIGASPEPEGPRTIGEFMAQERPQ